MRFVVGVFLLLIWASCLMTKTSVPTAALDDPHTIKIAIIDTGYGIEDPSYLGPKLKLCKSGHYDFEENAYQVGATAYHGTVIGNIIATKLQDTDYCAVVYQVMKNGAINDQGLINAIYMAYNQNVVAVNISLTGNRTYQAEYEALYTLSQRTKVFIAAGNDSADLTNDCTSFPACYKLDNTVIVGALDIDTRVKASYTNFGSPIDQWYYGDATWNGKRVRGTSYATPRALSQYVLSYAHLTQPAMNLQKPLGK